MWTWLGIGIFSALLGWVASVIARASTSREILFIIAVGVVGGLLGGFFLAPSLGGGSVGSGGGFSLPNLLISLLGSIGLLAILHLVQRRRVRRVTR